VDFLPFLHDIPDPHYEKEASCMRMLYGLFILISKLHQYAKEALQRP